MKKLAYYLFITGETPFEIFLKGDSYLAIFVAWAILSVGCLLLFYGIDVYTYLATDIFQCDCNLNYDKGRAFVFQMSSILFFSVVTIASIYKAYRIFKR